MNAASPIYGRYPEQSREEYWSPEVRHRRLDRYIEAVTGAREMRRVAGLRLRLRELRSCNRQVRRDIEPRARS